MRLSFEVEVEVRSEVDFSGYGFELSFQVDNLEADSKARSFTFMTCNQVAAWTCVMQVKVFVNR